MTAILLQGDARKIPLADNSVQCVITSPPYYGLRDYGVSDQIGLEQTLAEYIENICAVFDEVWRVLKDDGTAWLNLGDSYNNRPWGDSKTNFNDPKRSRDGAGNKVKETRNIVCDALKQKDLMLVPHRVAIALQERGWWVRSDIVWHKPNPMPESVTDRPTKAHEYIFLLSKSQRYYYDAVAVREDKADSTVANRRGNENGHHRERGYPGANSNGGTNLGGPEGSRNRRSVWTITTKPYSGAHFATFPPELPEICIKASTPEAGECPICGAPWARIVKREKMVIERTDWGERAGNQTAPSGKMVSPPRCETLGWKATCEHDAEPIPSIVLDPFGGSGTTAMVANKLGRVGISLDLSFEYLEQAKERTGLVKMEEWLYGKQDDSEHDDLPLFKWSNNG